MTHRAHSIIVSEPWLYATIKDDSDSILFSQLVVEAASGAAVYAAIHMMDEVQPPPRKVGVILCGGNTDLDNLPWLTRSTTYNWGKTHSQHTSGSFAPALKFLLFLDFWNLVFWS